MSEVSDDKQRVRAFMHVEYLVAALAGIAIVIFNDHRISLEGFSQCVGFITCCVMAYRRYSLRTTLALSLLACVGCFLVAPLGLEFTPAAILRPFVHMPFGSRLQPNLENMVHLAIRTYENITLAEAKAIVYDTKEPVLFKGLIANAESKGQRIVDRVVDSGHKFSMQQFQPKPYDFFRGSQYTTGHVGTATDALNSSSNYYISFEPLVLQQEVVELLDRDLQSRFVVDSSFISNFNETVVTTFVHGAPATMSWAIQMVGRKTWFLWDPSIVKRLNGGWFCRVSVPGLGDEADLFSSPAIRVTVSPGDVLVFPPLFYHTVVTHRGPNLMLNIRTKFGHWFPSIIPALRLSAATMLSSIFGQSNPHHLHGIRYLRKLDMEEVFKVSPNSMRWEDVEKFI